MGILNIARSSTEAAGSGGETPARELSEWSCVAGQRALDDDMLDAARVLFNNTGNFAQLALVLCKLDKLQDAVEAARKANHVTTWITVAKMCVDKEEFRMAQQAGMHIIIEPQLRATMDVARPMSCVPGYFQVINTHTVGSLTIPRASIKWV